MTERNKGKAFKPVLLDIWRITPPRDGSQGAVVVHLSNMLVNVPRHYLYLHDPADVSRCVPATDIDADLMLRLTTADSVLGWTQQWLIDAKELVIFPIPVKKVKVSA